MGRRIFCFALPLFFIALLFVSCSDKADDMLVDLDINISVDEPRGMMLGSEVPAPKSLSHARPVERAFAKADDNDITKGGVPDEKKENVFSMTTNHREIAELLDQATFAKGYDEEFSKACTAYEAVHTLPANIIARMKNEFGVEIVK